MSEVPNLPIHNFNKGQTTTDNPEVAQRILENKILPLDPSSETNDERLGKWKEVPKKAADKIALWIEKRTGLNTSDRLHHAAEKTRFITSYNEINAIKSKFGKRFNVETGGGHISATGEIYINLQAPVNRLSDSVIHTISHELIHAASNNTLGIVESEDGYEIKQLHSGYTNTQTGAFRILNEAITESMTLEHLSSVYSGDSFRIPYVSYAEAVIFLDMLIGSAAERLGRSAYDIRTQIYTGYIKGDFNALRVFTDAFGKDALGVLARLPGEASEEDAVGHAMSGIADLFRLDTNEYMHRTRGYILEGHNVTLFGNLRFAKRL